MEHSDEPFFIAAKILKEASINIIVDGGASIGDTSLRLSELFPDSKVYSFEPYPPFIEILKKKTKDNPNIEVQPFALDETEGSKAMMVNESEGTNSFFTANQLENQPYGDLMRKKDEIEVTSKTLDHWAGEKKMNGIDLLKLDLQGNELATLRGATQHLETNKVKAILTEVSFVHQYENQPLAPEVMVMLNSYDFDLFNLYQMHYHHGQLVQADALFLHRSVSEGTIRASKPLFLPHSKFLS